MPSRDQYTDPKLRDQVKEEIHEGDKGGEPGQWTARKAQMMAQEYKKRGGDYTTDKQDKDSSQQNITHWDDDNQKQGEKEEKESDKNGSEHKEESKAKAKNGENGKDSNGSSGDKKTDSKKEDDESRSKNDKADSDEKAQAGQKRAHEDDTSDNQNKAQKNNNGEGSKSGSNKSASESKKDEDVEEKDSKQEANGKTKDNESKDDKDDDNDKEGGKKSYGSRHDTKEPTEQKGSNDRLPKKGQKITWKAMPGYVEGKVVEVLTSDKEVDGKQVKASEKDPRIVAESDSSGKICVHKPESMYYDKGKRCSFGRSNTYLKFWRVSLMFPSFLSA